MSKKPTILVIDSNPENLLALRSVLAKNMPDVDLIGASCSNEGICVGSEIDAVFVNCQDADQCGIEKCRKMKSNTLTSHIPMALYSSGSAETLRDAAIKSKADFVMAMPIDNQDIISKTKMMLRLKKAHDELREMKCNLEQTVKKNQQLEFVLEGSNLGWWDWEIATGKEEFNEILPQLLGYKLSEIKPSFDWWMENVHPDDVAQLEKDVKDHFEGKTEFYINKQRLRTASGEYKWFIDHGKVVVWDDDGKPARMLGCLRKLDEGE